MPTRLQHVCGMALYLALLSGCTQSTSTQPPDSSPVSIILDTDMGSDCDDVGALALLHEYQIHGQAQILAVVYSSGAVPFGAGIIDGINRYYGHPNIPIGALQDTTFGDPVDKMQAEKLAKDTTAFGNRIIHNHDAEDLVRLARRVLSQQPDQSVVYVTIGHTRGLADLLQSGPDEISDLTGHDLLAQTLKSWVALGALQAANEEQQYRKDWNFFFNGSAPFTEYLVEQMPVPSYFINAGSNVMTGASLRQTPSGNIVRTAYRDWLWNVFGQTLADQRPSWDLAAVYFAVEGEGAFLEQLPPGYLEFDNQKGNRWVTNESDTRHVMVIEKPDVTEPFAHYLNGKIAAHGIRTARY